MRRESAIAADYWNNILTYTRKNQPIVTPNHTEQL